MGNQVQFGGPTIQEIQHALRQVGKTIEAVYHKPEHGKRIVVLQARQLADGSLEVRLHTDRENWIAVNWLSISADYLPTVATASLFEQEKAV